jgi:hypothetical protein
VYGAPTALFCKEGRPREGRSNGPEWNSEWYGVSQEGLKGNTGPNDPISRSEGAREKIQCRRG